MLKYLPSVGHTKREREETLTPSRISMIEMPVRPTLDIMSSGHNISGAGGHTKYTTDRTPPLSRGIIRSLKEKEKEKTTK